MEETDVLKAAKWLQKLIVQGNLAAVAPARHPYLLITRWFLLVELHGIAPPDGPGNAPNAGEAKQKRARTKGKGLWPKQNKVETKKSSKPTKDEKEDNDDGDDDDDDDDDDDADEDESEQADDDEEGEGEEDDNVEEGGRKPQRKRRKVVNPGLDNLRDKVKHMTETEGQALASYRNAQALSEKAGVKKAEKKADAVKAAKKVWNAVRRRAQRARNRLSEEEAKAAESHDEKEEEDDDFQSATPKKDPLTRTTAKRKKGWKQEAKTKTASQDKPNKQGTRDDTDKSKSSVRGHTTVDVTGGTDDEPDDTGSNDAADLEVASLTQPSHPSTGGGKVRPTPLPNGGATSALSATTMSPSSSAASVTSSSSSSSYASPWLSSAAPAPGFITASPTVLLSGLQEMSHLQEWSARRSGGARSPADALPRWPLPPGQ